ncbi:MAG TPA: 50S ribosomal protein L23 [Dehalococcoidia bacterium]|nr:50S ribosomal protein L23 [Dehalococcoidia bacterium]
MHLYEVLRRPLITEKATSLKEKDKYVFEVASKATEAQIKEAVEKAFKVKVSKVNVMTVPGKTRKFGRRQVTGSPWKKAVVTLEPGHKITLFEGV